MLPPAAARFAAPAKRRTEDERAVAAATAAAAAEAPTGRLPCSASGSVEKKQKKRLVDSKDQNSPNAFSLVNM